MSVAKRARHGWLLAPALACSMVGGCSDDDGDDNDGSIAAPVDSGARDTGTVTPATDGGVGMDGSVNIDAGQDAGPAPWRSDASVTDKTVALQISALGSDGFQGVAYDSAGNVFAAGYTTDSKGSGADYSFALSKFKADGSVDKSFGVNGVAIKNIIVGGLGVERARGVVVQADGKVIVSGDVEHIVPGAGVDGGVLSPGVLAGDSDVALVRFNANGTVDSTFGTNGIAIHNLNDGIETTATDAGVSYPVLTGRDQSWNLIAAGDKLVVHASSRASGVAADGGVRTDTDYTLLRLTGNGAADPSFGTNGVVRTDFAQTNASARAVSVLADGKFVAAGYTRSGALGADAQQPVLYKVNADGTPDTSFATTDPIGVPGVWHGYARKDMKNAEAYNAALQGNKFVTVGYGPNPSGKDTTSDWVLFRFNADGTQDTAFGVDGTAFVDPGGYSDNGRALAILPDNRIVAVGGGRPKPVNALPMGQTPQTDAMIAILGPDGQLDDSFAAGGYRLYNFGGQGDFFHAVAVSPSKKQVAVVGVAGAVTDQQDDDAVLLLLTLDN